jgi:uncharacterized protein
MKIRLLSMAFAALLLSWAVVSCASDYEDGLAAYNGGDYKTALAMFTKAANNGDAKAQYMMAGMYADGLGVSQDYVEAYKWFNIVVAGPTDKEAQDLAIKSRDDVAKKMTPAQIAEAQKRAKEWKKK